MTEHVSLCHWGMFPLPPRTASEVARRYLEAYRPKHQPEPKHIRDEI